MKKYIKIISVVLLTVLSALLFSSCNMRRKFEPITKDPNGAFVINIDNKVIISPYKLNDFLSYRFEFLSEAEKVDFDNDKLKQNYKFDLSTSKNGIINVSAFKNDKTSPYVLNYINIDYAKLGESKAIIQGVELGKGTPQDILNNFGDNFSLIKGALEVSSLDTIISYTYDCYTAKLYVDNGVLVRVEIFFNKPILMTNEDYKYNILTESVSNDETVYRQYFFNDPSKVRINSVTSKNKRNDFLQIQDENSVCYVLKPHSEPVKEPFDTTSDIEIVNMSALMDTFEPSIQNNSLTYLRDTNLPELPIYRNNKLTNEKYIY